jgi:hypothetical protein
MTPLFDAQRDTCRRYGVEPDPPGPHTKIGLGRDEPGILPVNGLRHSPEGDTSGWYIWRGEVLSSDEDYFMPVHVEHLAELCPEAIPFLALPPGWRFLLASGNEDVWFDPSLLDLA